MSNRNVLLAALGAAVVSALVWFGLTQLVSSSCDYDCTDKGGRDAYLAVLVAVALFVPAVSLAVTMRRLPPGYGPRIVIGANVLVSTGCVLVAIALTIIVVTGQGDTLVGLVAAVLWIGAALASLAVRRLNAASAETPAT